MPQLLANRAVNKISRRGQAAIKKNRSGNCFKDISQQGVFITAATLLFPTTKTQEVAKVQTKRSLSECGRAYEPMFHPRKLALRNLGMRTAEIISNNQSKYRVTEKL